MVIQEDVDVQQVWRAYRTGPTTELRNYLVERYLPLVKYNAERIWSRLPEGVELQRVGLVEAIEGVQAFLSTAHPREGGDRG